MMSSLRIFKAAYVEDGCFSHPVNDAQIYRAAGSHIDPYEIIYIIIGDVISFIYIKSTS